MRANLVGSSWSRDHQTPASGPLPRQQCADVGGAVATPAERRLRGDCTAAPSSRQISSTAQSALITTWSPPDGTALAVSLSHLAITTGSVNGLSGCFYGRPLRAHRSVTPITRNPLWVRAIILKAFCSKLISQQMTPFCCNPLISHLADVLRLAEARVRADKPFLRVVQIGPTGIKITRRSTPRSHDQLFEVDYNLATHLLTALVSR